MKTILILTAIITSAYGIGYFTAPTPHVYDRVAMDRLMTDLQFEPSFYIDEGEQW